MEVPGERKERERERERERGRELLCTPSTRIVVYDQHVTVIDFAVCIFSGVHAPDMQRRRPGKKSQYSSLVAGKAPSNTFHIYNNIIFSFFLFSKMTLSKDDYEFV